MNYGNLSKQSRGFKDIRVEVDHRVLSLRQSWLAHPGTGEFLEHLENQVKEANELLIALSSGRAEINKIFDLGVKIKTIKEILTYARGN